MIDEKRLAEISMRLDRLLGTEFVVSPASLGMEMRGVDLSPVYVDFDRIETDAEINDKLVAFACDLHASSVSVNKFRELLMLFEKRFMPALTAVPEPDANVVNCIEFLKIAKLERPVKDISKMRMIFYYNATIDTHLIMINGADDGVLVELGTRFGMPRGCTVLWKQGRSVDLRGFFPKFENDKKSETEFDHSLLEKAAELSFFKKWSGYLLHVIAFEDKGKLYWTVCSKKSANKDSEYLKNGRSMMSTKMTTPLVAELASKHLYLGGEAIHTSDVHGYIANGNAVITTCVGEGTFADLTGVTDNVARSNSFMNYWSPDGVFEFAKKYGLSCDSPITVNNVGDSDAIKQFILTILADRDLLDNTIFDARIASIRDGVKVRKGDTSHSDLIGRILEGFVFNITYAPDSGKSKKTVKVKLPHYTWRTMLLREVIADRYDEERVGKIPPYDFVSRTTADKIDRFANHWCCTDLGKQHFPKYLKAAFVKLHQGGIPVGKQWKRYHVEVADAVTALGGSELNELVAEFDRIVPPNGVKGDPICVCLVLGPIGSGKSTVMSMLAPPGSTQFAAIDGDLVAGVDTFTMGAERNALTFAAVYKAILQGKTPVVSLGGGVFCKGKTPELCLGESIKKVFGHETNFVTVLMNGASDGGSNVESVSFSQLEGSKFFDTEYARLTAESLKATIAARVARSDPLYPEKKGSDAESRLKAMFDGSKRNKDFARAIASTPNNTLFTVRYVAENNYEFLTKLDLSEIHSALRPASPGITSGKFDQIRATFMVDLSSFGGKFTKSGSHITLFYREKGDDQGAPLAKLDGLDTAVLERCDAAGAVGVDVYTLWFKPSNWSDENLEMVKKHGNVCKKVVVAVLPGAIGGRDGLHLTEDPGPFPASDMKLVSGWINAGMNGELRMSADPKSKDKGDYILEYAEEHEVELVVHAASGKTQKFKIPKTVSVQTVQYYYKGIAAFVRGDA